MSYEPQLDDDIALGYDDETVIYFIENDYLHKLNSDKILIKDFYPKYERTFESENEYGEIEIFKKRIEYLAAPFLFILYLHINILCFSNKVL